ncbi:uncharacterized protein LOC125232321 [Leguminivora glycinivorella]|uniref:uncharacterized protein LOC125232321 n=1 Tax=Leguminivora glycinivorella TaxID=1035111 RepID=UPI00200DD03C|nr:uncharacterized protein LOC125232321 [Leguminivora glycinivorella]
MDALPKSGKKAWIQTKKKDELIILANSVVKDEDIKFSNENSVEEIRRFLRDYIEEQEEYRECTAEKLAYKMNSISNLEVFTGGNWRAYKQQLVCFFLLNDIDVNKKVPLLITKLGASVYELLTTICTPDSPVNLTYDQICDKLEKHYHPVRNYALEQAEFRKRNQQKDENLDKYILELKKLSKNCNFNNINDEIKERLFNGTFYEAVKFEVLKQADLPMEKLVEIGKTVEAAYNLTYKNEEKETKPQMFKLERNRGYGSRHETTKSKPEAGGSTGICFCCGKEGHMRAECTLRMKFCSECGTKGHIYKMCTQNKDNWRVKTLNVVDKETYKLIGNEEKSKRYDTPGPVSYDMFHCSEKDRIPSQKLSVHVNGKLLEFEVDTGADVSTITCSDKK